MVNDIAAAAPLDDLFAPKPEFVSTSFAWSPKARPLEGRRTLLQAALYVYLAFQAVGLLLILVELFLMWALKTGEQLDSIPGARLFAQAVTTAGPGIIPASYLVFAICALCYFLFVYRAARNLDLSKARGLQFTPRAVVWMSFVPFVNLGSIPTAMRQIWRASSHPTTGLGEAPGVFSWWWACYIINGFVGAASNLVSRGMETAAPSDAFDRFLPVAAVAMISAVLLTISVFCLLNIIATITHLQRDLRDAATFS